MKKAAGYLGIILAIVFVILAFATPVPDKYIKSYGTGKMYEYVGGDAYNFIIEASLRGGEIAGAQTSKAIYFGVAAILAVLSCSFLTADSKAALKTDFTNIKADTTHPDEAEQLSDLLQPEEEPNQNEPEDQPDYETDEEATDAETEDEEQNDTGKESEEDRD